MKTIDWSTVKIGDTLYLPVTLMVIGTKQVLVSVKPQDARTWVGHDQLMLPIVPLAEVPK